jgi:hypothetical protein
MTIAAITGSTIAAWAAGASLATHGVDGSWGGWLRIYAWTVVVDEGIGDKRLVLYQPEYGSTLRLMGR